MLSLEGYQKNLREPKNGGVIYDENTGQTIEHNTDGYVSSSGEVYNNGNRYVALIDQLTEAEKTEYQNKINALNNKANFDGSISLNGFSINFDTNSKGQNLKSLTFDISQSGSYIKSGDIYSYKTDVIDKSLFGTGARKAYPSAALIELLSRLTDSLFIKGGFGTWRGIIGPNFSALTEGNNSVSDHAFGRGFDIGAVGITKQQAYWLGSAPAASYYLQALTLLLSYIEQMPQSLHPDLIVIGDNLRDQLGVREGLESADSVIRKSHPNLAGHVNFHADSSHRNHIHISFGAKRGGAILPASAMLPPTTPATTGGAGGAGGTGGAGVAASITAKLRKSYYTGDPNLSPDEVFTLFNDFGNFSEEAAAIWTGMALRESSWNPWSTNSSGFVGLLQVGTRSNSGGLNKTKLVIPNEEVLEMWKLAYAEWKRDGLDQMTNEQRDAFIRDKQRNDPTNNAGRQYWDRRAFIPINQLYMFRSKQGKTELIRLDTISKAMGKAWGDSFLYHGFISGGWTRGPRAGKNTYWYAQDVYKRLTGKSADDLANWVLRVFPQDSRSRNPDPITKKSSLQSWIDGKIYKPIYKSRQPDGSRAYNPPEGWPKKPAPN